MRYEREAKAVIENQLSDIQNPHLVIKAMSETAWRDSMKSLKLAGEM